MPLNDRQRVLMVDILYGDHVVPDRDESWDNDRGNDLMWGGHPLQRAEERWEWRPAQRLRMMASVMAFDFPTWLTTDEIIALSGEIIPGAHAVEVDLRGELTPVYNVAEIRGLPAHFYRPFWEIHPVHRDPRHPGFAQYVGSLGVTIQHAVNRQDGWTLAEYREIPNKIIMPPFEMFFSAPDYYRTLAHELVHWAVANTDLVTSILDSALADYARNELVSDFAAMFLLAEQGFSDLPHPRTVAYVRNWRDKGSLTDAQAMDAAEDAARVTAWLCHEAPAMHARPSPSNRDPRHSPTSRPARTDVPTLKAAAVARRFVADAFAMERSIGRMDHDAWDREAARLLEIAGTIDLGVSIVVAAIEASVAIETPDDAEPLSATAWLRSFRERTARIRATKGMMRSANDMSVGMSRGPRF